MIWYCKLGIQCISVLVPFSHKQVPARSSSCVDKFLEEFRSEIPIFKLLGTTKLIQSDAQYSVDSGKKSGVQLVCKYLKAYETGGRKGIDKLYKEGRIVGAIMFF